jgi:hypothetical protein
VQYRVMGHLSKIRRAAYVGVIVSSFLMGCGDTSEGTESADSSRAAASAVIGFRTSHSSDARVRSVRWSVLKVARQSIQIGAFVPYCEGKLKPEVARVSQARHGRKIVLTLFIREPSKGSSACVGYDLGLSQWVKLGKSWHRDSIYDGHGSPPALRIHPS